MVDQKTVPMNDYFRIFHSVIRSLWNYVTCGSVCSYYVLVFGRIFLEYHIIYF